MEVCHCPIFKILITISVLGYDCGYTQQIPTFDDESELELISEGAETTPDFTDLTDDYTALREHPVNLNKTSEEELHSIKFLTDRQIKNLAEYINTYGALVSVFELRAIPGFDSLTILKMEPFITIRPVDNVHPISLRNLLKYGRNQVFLRYQQVLQHQKGYLVDDSLLRKNPNAGYLGSQQGYYLRYTYDYYNRVDLGFSGAKSPGEEFFKGSQPWGMDYYSGYLSLKRISFLKTLILGNYRVDFGQGLTLSSGLSTGSGMTSGNMKRYPGGLRPTLAMNGGSYLMGAAVAAVFGKTSVTLFYSNHKRDGNITTIDPVTGDPAEFSSLTSTGYHRLPREIADKNTIRETILGGNLNFRNDFMSIGFTAFRSHWSASLTPRIYPYNQFGFIGDHNLNAGMDFLFLYRNVYFFGEAGCSQNGGLAGLSGFLATPDPAVTFSMIWRYYQRNYQNLLSNARGQNSGNANETGFLFNINAHLLPGLGISGYADLCAFPWIKYRTDFPSNGKEYRIQADCTLRQTLMYLRFRWKEKQLNGSSDTGYMHPATAINSLLITYHLLFPVATGVTLQSKAEMVCNQQEGKQDHFGYLVSQNIHWKPEKLPLSATILYALFDTYSYDERIYSYENDVLYGYSIPACEGKGIRSALLLSCSALRHIDFWFRYAITWYNDRSLIGTGLEEIKGNAKSEVKLQLRYRF
jgi:hypothetical protein